MIKTMCLKINNKTNGIASYHSWEVLKYINLRILEKWGRDFAGLEGGKKKLFYPEIEFPVSFSSSRVWNRSFVRSRFFVQCISPICRFRAQFQKWIMGDEKWLVFWESLKAQHLFVVDDPVGQLLGRTSFLSQSIRCVTKFSLIFPDVHHRVTLQLPYFVWTDFFHRKHLREVRIESVVDVVRQKIVQHRVDSWKNYFPL